MLVIGVQGGHQGGGDAREGAVDHERGYREIQERREELAHCIPVVVGGGVQGAVSRDEVVA